ncbi:MAG TPA: hypothetical protein PLV13_11955, partial [Ilumatobacteraceae bacterium]|nr:hypothetical protein [Ilumatobacteraceae bacterium]
PPNYRVFENQAYTPTRAQLTPQGAEASQRAGGSILAQADLSGSIPFGTGAPDRGDFTGPINAGTLHVAVPYDESWTLTVNGQKVAPRRAFGSTMAFDVTAPGEARLAFDTPTTRTLVVVLQLLAWLTLTLLASTVRVRLRRRTDQTSLDETGMLVDLRAPLPDGYDGGTIDATPVGLAGVMSGADIPDVWEVTAPTPPPAQNWAEWGDD